MMVDYFKFLFYSIVFILLISCSATNKSPKLNVQVSDVVKMKDSIILKNWHFKDIELDTVPGISLQRAYDSLLNDNKKSKEIIVAIIDMEIDIYHDGLKSHIWRNENEIINNEIDDDHNGYIDDHNGWNFLGNLSGENNLHVNFEYTRIVRNWTPYFQKVDTTNLSTKDSLNFVTYQSAREKYAWSLAYYQDIKDSNINLYEYYYSAKESLKNHILNNDYSLDNLKKIKPNLNEQEVLEACDLLIELIEYGIDDEYVNLKKYHYTEVVDKLLGLEYNDRTIQGDDPNDLNDVGYGNNKLSENLKMFDHGTFMAGIISSISFDNKIKIMPLSISAYGDEHDKDIALAIRYAVDNGAKVINMSWWKLFSQYPEWVHDAIRYAEKNDVLLVSIAGNDGLDLYYHLKYPNDQLDDGSEIADNFMLVGASNHTLSKNFKMDYSNYGNTDVDLFAPGNAIYTTAPFNKYTNESGGTSSAAAITSGVAALIRSYYPDLTASQVKHILMDSGIEYTLDVSTPTKEDPEKTTPFNKLSKSGRVLNAYNALLMADRVSSKN